MSTSQKSRIPLWIIGGFAGLAAIVLLALLYERTGGRRVPGIPLVHHLSFYGSYMGLGFP